MMGWQEYCLEMRQKHPELSWRQLGELTKTAFPNDFKDEAMDKVRSYIRRKVKSEQKSIEQPDTTVKLSGLDNFMAESAKVMRPSVEYKADGSVTSDRLIELCEGVDITPEVIIKAHGFDPCKWQVVTCKNNWWHAKDSEYGRIIMYQSKLVVKPLANGLDTKLLDQYFASKTFSNTKPIIVPKQYDPDGEVLEIDVPDWHAGLLAWRMEVGADYDLEIAQMYFKNAIGDILQRVSTRRFKKIIFCTLGDLLHVDNDDNKTTKGTPQNVDGRTTKTFEKTADLLIDTLDALLSIAPVEVIYTSGNHDRLQGHALMTAVSKAYRNDPKITFDTTPNPQKALVIGSNLIGLAHGDMPHKNMFGWLPNRYRREYGMAKTVEIHAGHFHSNKVGEYKQTEEDPSGIVLRHLPSICNASMYEHKEGYPAGTRTIVSFVWNEETGLREQWYSNIA